MVILGLGSNLGDRLNQLRLALNLLKALPEFKVLQVSPLYISDALLPENAPDNWNIPYLNLALRCETSLKPLDLLEKIKFIEKQVGRLPEKDWGPRIIDIDILAWDDLIRYDEKLHIPHEHLHIRPFALWPFCDVAPMWIYPLPGPFKGHTASELVKQWGSRFNGNAPLHTRQIPHRIDTPALIGILNLTPDSFATHSFNNLDEITNHAKSLINQGAEIIDIGAEATGPNAKPITHEMEWQRLEPVLQKLSQIDFIIPPKISIDTRHPKTATKALQYHCQIINDVSGLDNEEMCNLLKNHTCDIIFMHHLGVPVDKNKILPLNKNPIDEVFLWAKNKINFLEEMGIAKERLIFDVGIGYGKSAEQSLQLIKSISEFSALGVRLLAGHSRKSFLSQFTNQDAFDRDIESNAVSIFLAKQGIDYLRLHNVDTCARTFKVLEAL